MWSAAPRQDKFQPDCRYDCGGEGEILSCGGAADDIGCGYHRSPN
ncbi:MAG TPA: hypothetical protein VMP01_01725 [Pirellulaceae bacterium]|nr:hypothetical protein [Pirellulaceae bacterium]